MTGIAGGGKGDIQLIGICFFCDEIVSATLKIAVMKAYLLGGCYHEKHTSMPQSLRRKNGVLSIDRKKDGMEYFSFGDRGGFGCHGAVCDLLLVLKGGSYGKRRDTRD